MVLPMTSKLDSAEKEIVDAFESGGLKWVEDSDALLERHRDYAAATFRKNARINTRVSSGDLRGLQKRARARGIPYQTLIASVLHQYVDGRLNENN